jgi:hypothetical protein
MDNQSVSEKTKRFANSALSWMMSLDPDPTHPDANWCLRLRDHHDEEAMAAKLTHAYSLQKSKG